MSSEQADQQTNVTGDGKVAAENNSSQVIKAEGGSTISNVTQVAVAGDLYELSRYPAAMPDAQVEFRIIKQLSETNPPYYSHFLTATAKNRGSQAINNFKLEFTFPYIGAELVYLSPSENFKVSEIYGEHGGPEHYRVVDRAKEVLFPEDEVHIGAETQWPYCFKYSVSYDIHEKWVRSKQKSKSSLTWTLYADDMPPKQGEISFSQLYD